MICSIYNDTTAIAITTEKKNNKKVTYTIFSSGKETRTGTGRDLKPTSSKYFT